MLQTDHLGNTFKSIKEMCEYHGTTITLYKSRRKRGLSQKDALTLGKKKTVHNPTTTHLSIRVEPDILQQIYNISQKSNTTITETVTSLIEYALAENGQNKIKHITDKTNRGKVTTDHLGNKFKSVREMLDHYNIDKATYAKRLKKGLSQEEALCTPIKKRTNHYDLYIPGKKYKSKSGLDFTFNCLTTENGSSFAIGQFEDGTTGKIRTERLPDKITHPQLKTNKECHYRIFKTKYLCTNDDSVFYCTKCDICGLEKIFTPQEMLEHQQQLHPETINKGNQRQRH